MPVHLVRERALVCPLQGGHFSHAAAKRPLLYLRLHLSGRNGVPGHYESRTIGQLLLTCLPRVPTSHHAAGIRHSQSDPGVKRQRLYFLLSNLRPRRTANVSQRFAVPGQMGKATERERSARERARRTQGTDAGGPADDVLIAGSSGQALPDPTGRLVDESRRRLQHTGPQFRSWQDRDAIALLGAGRGAARPGRTRSRSNSPHRMRATERWDRTLAGLQQPTQQSKAELKAARQAELKGALLQEQGCTSMSPERRFDVGRKPAVDVLRRPSSDAREDSLNGRKCVQERGAHPDVQPRSALSKLGAIFSGWMVSAVPSHRQERRVGVIVFVPPDWWKLVLTTSKTVQWHSVRAAFLSVRAAFLSHGTLCAQPSFLPFRLARSAPSGAKVASKSLHKESMHSTAQSAMISADRALQILNKMQAEGIRSILFGMGDVCMCIHAPNTCMRVFCAGQKKTTSFRVDTRSSQRTTRHSAQRTRSRSASPSPMRSGRDLLW